MFIHSFKGIYQAPSVSNVLGTGDTSVNKTKSLSSWSFSSGVQRQKIKKKKKKEAGGSVMQGAQLGSERWRQDLGRWGARPQGLA